LRRDLPQIRTDSGRFADAAEQPFGLRLPDDRLNFQRAVAIPSLKLFRQQTPPNLNRANNENFNDW
jgi:hypothetical protein